MNERERLLLDALERTLVRIDDPRAVVARNVPEVARAWAAEHGLEVHQTAFAPAGQIFITGAIPVDYEVPL